jgi:hypothetical protein
MCCAFANRIGHMLWAMEAMPLELALRLRSFCMAGALPFVGQWVAVWSQGYQSALCRVICDESFISSLPQVFVLRHSCAAHPFRSPDR